MKLLAFDTSTEACSVAVWDDGRVLERFEVAPRRHAGLALPWAEALLAEAGIARSQLDGLAVSRGPGAFTGVRLGVALVQGIALALDRPVVAQSTLAVLAMRAGAGEGGRVLAAIDARMGELYTAAFEVRGDAPHLLSPERVGAPDGVELPPGGSAWLGVGTGFAACGAALRLRLGEGFARIDADALPRAGDLARLAAAAFDRGEALAPERVEPAYLRDNVALTLVEQQARRAAR